METGRSLELAGQPVYPISELQVQWKTLSQTSKQTDKQRNKRIENDSGCPKSTSALHTHTHMHVHSIHTHTPTPTHKYSCTHASNARENVNLRQESACAGDSKDRNRSQLQLFWCLKHVGPKQEEKGPLSGGPAATTSYLGLIPRIAYSPGIEPLISKPREGRAS